MFRQGFLRHVPLSNHVGLGFCDLETSCYECGSRCVCESARGSSSFLKLPSSCPEGLQIHPQRHPQRDVYPAIAGSPRPKVDTWKATPDQVAKEEPEPPAHSSFEELGSKGSAERESRSRAACCGRFIEDNQGYISDHL